MQINRCNRQLLNCTQNSYSINCNRFFIWNRFHMNTNYHFYAFQCVCMCVCVIACFECKYHMRVCAHALFFNGNFKHSKSIVIATTKHQSSTDMTRNNKKKSGISETNWAMHFHFFFLFGSFFVCSYLFFLHKISHHKMAKNYNSYWWR